MGNGCREVTQRNTAGQCCLVVLTSSPPIIKIDLYQKTDKQMLSRKKERKGTLLGNISQYSNYPPSNNLKDLGQTLLNKGWTDVAGKSPKKPYRVTLPRSFSFHPKFPFSIKIDDWCLTLPKTLDKRYRDVTQGNIAGQYCCLLLPIELYSHFKTRRFV